MGMKMLRRVLLVLALCSGLPAAAFAALPLDEVRKSFTIGGKPIPPEIFADFGDSMMSDSRPIVVTIDASAAIDSNRYADPITTKGGWVEQTKLGSGSFNGPETMSYEFRGATANGMLVFLAAWSGGGSGTFYYLHILDAASNRAFDEDGFDLLASRPDPGAHLHPRRPLAGRRGHLRQFHSRCDRFKSRRPRRRIRDNRCAEALRRFVSTQIMQVKERRAGPS